ncbi:YaiI/YqxD family protein [candidate division KSB1 bacterium]|nr:MAG: YaiI/YqxD family protein [candidate division KSB1 bacterium]
MRILVDADACPAVVKEILFKTSKRLKLHVILVANQFMRTPASEYISNVVVAEGPDEADDRIVDIVQPDDLVVTADIPLADRVIKKGAVVLDPRGTLLTTENIGERLATRNLKAELRTWGIDSGGPASYGSREKQEFANQLDRFLTRVLAKQKNS